MYADFQLWVGLVPLTPVPFKGHLNIDDLAFLFFFLLVTYS